MKVGLFGYNDTCIKAYNPETKQVIGIYESYKEAGNKLGIGASVVQKTCARKGKTFSTRLQIKVSLRLSTKQSCV